jgi:uncharacterized surface protein with fasciclin (FAS1) repeats
MKTSTKLNITMMAAALMISVSVPALAGSCGSSTKHTHAESASMEVKTQAIFPLAEEAGFTTLVAAVKAAGLEGVLTNDGPFTVFAPTDEAFAKLPEGTVESLLANPEQLKKVLLYHVVSGNVMASDVVKLNSAQTLNGTLVAIDVKDGVKVNDSNVIKTDIAASNGTVHVIDTVLIPGNL